MWKQSESSIKKVISRQSRSIWWYTVYEGCSDCNCSFFRSTACYLLDCNVTLLDCAVVTQGSHLCVACSSICDWDQNGIKRTTFLLGADQGLKTNSEWLTSTESTQILRHGNMFVLWTLVKSSNQELWKGTIIQSRMIFTDQDSWSHWQTLLWAMYKWLPLGCMAQYSMQWWLTVIRQSKRRPVNYNCSSASIVWFCMYWLHQWQLFVHLPPAHTRRGAGGFSARRWEQKFGGTRRGHWLHVLFTVVKEIKVETVLLSR